MSTVRLPNRSPPASSPALYREERHSPRSPWYPSLLTPPTLRSIYRLAKLTAIPIPINPGAGNSNQPKFQVAEASRGLPPSSTDQPFRSAPDFTDAGMPVRGPGKRHLSAMTVSIQCGSDYRCQPPDFVAPSALYRSTPTYRSTINTEPMRPNDVRVITGADCCAR